MHPEYSIPGTCRATGLSCETCTEGSARNLARVCLGLRGKQVSQLFVQLYPHPACAPMHAHFARAYREAGAPDVSADGLCAAAAVA